MISMETIKNAFFHLSVHTTWKLITLALMAQPRMAVKNGVLLLWMRLENIKVGVDITGNHAYHAKYPQYPQVRIRPIAPYISISFFTDNIDAMDQSYQLTCRNPFDKMKVGGVFHYDLKELQYDCDKRYSHEERDIFNYKRLCLCVCEWVSESDSFITASAMTLI